MSQVGLRLVEEFRRLARSAIEEDPLRPVAQVFEELYSRQKEQLEGSSREEFISMCPPLATLSRSLYR